MSKEKNLNWAVLGTGVIANEMAQALQNMGKKLFISSFALWKAEKVYKKIYTRNQKKSFRFLAKKNKKRYHN